jgi:SpoVK/Ycf46/Vps4 family AAA+-type ATPase
MTRRRRTKWHRRGTAAADVLVGFFSALVAASFQLLLSFVRLFVQKIAQTSRKSETCTKRSVSGGGRNGSGANGLRRQFDPATVPTVRFDSVAGLTSAKAEILLRTVYPLHHPDKAATYKVESGGGVLLWGPPGCGKTLLAKAVAGELEAEFYHVRASMLIDQWVGEAEKNVAALFRQVRSHSRSVLFIDEIDAICPSRRRNGSTVMRRVIAEFLSQMDGFDTAAGCRDGGFHLTLGATNWPEALDEAILRPGRFDHCVFVELPDADARRHIIEQRLIGRPIGDDVRVDEIISQTDGYSGADVANLIETAARRAFLSSLQSTNDDRSISRSDLMESLADTRPSVSAAEFQRYREWQQKLSAPQSV